MGSYEDTVGILEVELGQVEQGFRGLSEAEWATPTKLRPLDETKEVVPGFVELEVAVPA